MLDASGNDMSGRTAGSALARRLVVALLLLVMVVFGVVKAEVDCEQDPDLWAHDQRANPTEVVQGEFPPH